MTGEFRPQHEERAFESVYRKYVLPFKARGVPSDILQIVSKMLQSALLFEYFLGLPRSRDHRVILKTSDYAIQCYVGRTWITHEAVGIIIIF